MSDTRRVYHPTLDAFQDVPSGDAEKWKASGWRLTRPAHVTDGADSDVENEPVIVTVTDAPPISK